MVALKDILSEIASVSKQLNEETDALNGIIEGIEASLASARVGVSVWKDFDIAVETFYNDDLGREAEDCWLLGYAKFGDAWRIVARNATRFESVEDGETSTQYRDHEAIVPLVQAPRLVRVEAAGHLERLLEAILRRAERFVDSIGKAKKLAQHGGTPSPIQGTGPKDHGGVYQMSKAAAESVEEIRRKMDRSLAEVRKLTE